MKKILFFVFQFFTIALFSQQKDFLLKNGKVVRMEKYDSSAVRTLINGKLTAVITNPSTDQILKYDGANWVNSTGGGGGGETLDQTLALGNVTDTAIVFNSSATSFYYFKGQPSNYLTDYGAKGIAGRFTGGWSVHDVNGSGRPNVVSFYGYNAGVGGGREISTEPSVSYRIESHFESGGDLIELHHPAMIYNNGEEKRLWSVYTNKSGLIPAGFSSRSDGIGFNSWLDENVTWGQIAPGRLTILQYHDAGSLPELTLGSLTDTLANTSWNIDYNFKISYVEGNAHEIRIGRPSTDALNNSSINMVVLDNLQVGSSATNRNINLFGDISLNKQNGVMIPNYDFSLGVSGGKFKEVWSRHIYGDTIHINKLVYQSYHLALPREVSLDHTGFGGSPRLNFGPQSGPMAYINADGGSGEIKHYITSGGYWPTFYSNGSEAMRLSTNQNMLIGTTSDNNSAILNVTSTSKGFLPPRMTKTQRDAISSPATGLVIYQTDNTPGLRCYNGTNWMRYTETAD